MSNPPAFPRPSTEYSSPQEGMTLRDYFAAAALTGLLGTGFMPNQVAQRRDETYQYEIAAYKLADAMLKARAR